MGEKAVLGVTFLCLWAKCVTILNEQVGRVSFFCFVAFNFELSASLMKTFLRASCKSMPLITRYEINSNHISTSEKYLRLVFYQ